MKRRMFSGRKEAGKNAASIYFACAAVIFLAGGVFSGCAGKNHPSEDELLIISAEKYACIEDYTARFSRMTDIGMKIEVEGEVSYKSPDRMRMNTTSIKGGRGTFWQVVVWDGESVWRENRGSSRRISSLHSYSISQVKPLLESDFLGMEKMDYSPDFYFSRGRLENFLEYYTFTLQGEKELSGNRVNIVAGDLKKRSVVQRLKEAFTLFPERIKLYIGAEDGFHYRKEYFDGDGNLIFFEEFEDVVFDSGLSEEIFSYHVPEGAEVQFADLSETKKICPVDESLPRAADFTLPDLEGNMHSLSGFHGRLIVLLITEPAYMSLLETMQVIHEIFRDREVEVIVVFRNRDIGSLTHHFDIRKFDFLALYTPEGYPNSLREDYEIRYATTIYYIDQEGRIRNSYAGPMPAARLRREIIDAGTRSGFFERNIRSEIPRLSEELELLSAAEMDMWFRKPEEAEKKLDKLLKINPDNLCALGLKARIATDAKRFEEAIEIYEELSRIAPDWDYPHNRIAFVCQYHFWRERRPFRGKDVIDYGIESHLRALEINPDNMHARSRLGHLYWRKGRYDEAIEQIKWPLKKNMSLGSGSLSELGYIYHMRGDLDKAVDYYRQSVDLNRYGRWTWVQLAGALEERGSIEEAIECYREIINIDPNAVDGHIAKARESLKRLGEEE